MMPTVMVPDPTEVRDPEVARIVAVPPACAVNTALLLSLAGTRSSETTPPVMFSRLQLLAAAFSTKLSRLSLVTANTVIDVPAVSDSAGTTLPDPSANVSTLTFLAAPGVTVRMPDAAAVSKPEVALMAAPPTAWAVKTALLPSTEGTRSPETTPPVTPWRLHASAATFAPKLARLSLTIAYTVIADPADSDCAGTTVPEPSGAVSTLTFVKAPGMTVSVSVFDGPPSGLTTVTGNIPATSRSLAGIEACSWVLLRKVVVLG